MRRKIFRRFVSVKSGLILLVAGLLFTGGCQNLNEDVNNKCVWFPSFVEPGYLNPYHESGYPDGTDPFPNANIGPKSLQARPFGYDLPRSWNADVTGTRTPQKKDSDSK